jgi:O-antigen biosynthesis protein
VSNFDSSSWFLVEGQHGVRSRHYSARLLVQCHSSTDEVEEIILPISQNGRIHELIRLPDDVTNLVWQLPVAEMGQQPPVNIRRVGWFERTWRMANRVIGIYKKLTNNQRAQIDLSLWKAISDLSGAYSIATKFREQLSYSDWVARYDRLYEDDVERIRQHIADFAHPPHFHLLLRVDGAEREAINATLNSLKKQLYNNFTYTILDVMGKGDSGFGSDIDFKRIGTNSCIVAQPNFAAWLDHLNGTLAEQHEWVMLLQPGDVLSAHSLYWFACESLTQPQAAVLYSDDDVLNSEGQRCHPKFKPDWSLAHLRSTHFMGDAVMLRGSEVAAAGGISCDCCKHGNYDLLLRVIDVAGDEGENSVAHIPAVLVHQMQTDLSSPHLQEERGLNHGEVSLSQWRLSSLQAHLARNGAKGEVLETLPGCWRVRHQLPDVPPLVSIIVPTRDELVLIRQCVEKLLSKTTYPRFEMLVVDNQTRDPEALEYLAQIAGQVRIRVLRYDQPFNYSAINNFAVRESRGEVLCLLNNDTEVISSDWLEDMIGHLLQPKVGVVGAKLYFQDGRVQHAGDTVGPGGCANHLHSLIEQHDPGYCNRAAVAQELSAVTGACMVTWKFIYQQMGGLDEKHLQVTFNDVDYCLRVRDAGYRVVWTPHAELYHHESVSRGKDKSPEKIRRAQREVAYMRKRWKRMLQHDPFYNPNLSYERSDFSLSHAPMVKRPWQK